MPQPQVKEKKLPYLGERVFFEWRAPEYRNLKKIKQYTKIFLVLIGLLIIWALYFSNYLFILFLVITCAILLALEGNQPQKLHRFALTDSGLWIDNELRPFIELRAFAVVPYATKHDRFFMFYQTKGGEIRVSVPVEETEKIRLMINQYMPQQEYKEGLKDALDRIFW